MILVLIAILAIAFFFQCDRLLRIMDLPRFHREQFIREAFYTTAQGFVLFALIAAHCSFYHWPAPYFLSLIPLGLSARTALNCYKALHAAPEVSRSSVEEALNRLPVGLLCRDRDGFPLMINGVMQQIIKELNGKTPHEGRRNINGTWWNFKRRNIRLEGKDWEILTATDITGKQLASRELETLHRTLLNQTHELERNGHDISSKTRTKALSRLQNLVHDMAGYRVYLLRQYLKNDADDLNHLDRFIPLITSLIDDLKSTVPASSDRLLKSLQAGFAAIGVSLELLGGLPEDEDQSAVIVKLLREAATNAVKHAEAKKITARISQENGQLFMDISNDGAPYTGGTIKENQGLKGMRNLIAPFNGTLTITPSPVFTLHFTFSHASWC